MAVSPASALDYLRTRSIVDCDTLDAKVAQTLGPFQDCTSNQAIAFAELSKPERKELLAESHFKASTLLRAMAETREPRFVGIELDELAVEIATVKLAIQVTPYLRGRVHVQTNPYYAYSTEKTIANAFRIVYLFKDLAPQWDSSRICIKIPSTWEGMMACRTLQLAGVHTLATTLFSMPQAVLASEVGCTYIAPYVNQLKVHFEPGFVDPNKLFMLCCNIQQYYKIMSSVTKVLPASLTSTDDVLALAGVDHITIAPSLLQLLSLPAGPRPRSIFDKVTPAMTVGLLRTSYLKDEAAYRIAFTRDLGGASEEKLTQAINIFCDMQDKLIALVKSKSE
ncbi:putative transaldolase [Talaromyces proteolyticus]|uniref:Transaldolase n=1 Tax=Talaromyces proteolyticus TaxID=1131652 RepID=A0AAD4KXD7_9EURO|nr:putative transaldolase [Talaromyces proteolyticus]KAH8702264.1 putative transaldolase [Talaromyces proteolyticus]